jgi:type I restriction enzyme S subunit
MKDWTTKPLGDLCEVFADGDWVESKDQSNTGVRLIQTGNVGEGVFKDRGDKARYISEETFRRLRCTEIIEGDCLISRLPEPAGRSCLIPDTGEKMITAVDCTIVRFKRDQIIPEFFNYYSQSSDYLKGVDSETTGTTRKRISRSKLGMVNIPVPPLPEQERIVGILDEAFDGIAKAKATAEANLQNARALFQSHLQSVFSQKGEGWVVTPLAECLKLITYGFTNPMPTTEDGPYMVTARNVVGGKIDYNSTRHTSLEAFNTLLTDKSRPLIGDILLTKDGTLGRVAVVDREGICINQSVAVLRPNEKINAQYLCYLLSSSDYQARMIDDAGGTTIKHIYITRVDKMEISFPRSLAEQEKLVSKLDALSAETQRLETLYQNKLHALDELKKSLLHQAFSGNL